MVQQWHELLSKDIPDYGLRAWLFAALVAIVLFLGLQFLKGLFARRAKMLKGRGVRHLDKVVEYVFRNTRRTFLMLVSLYVGSQFVEISPKAELWLRNAVVLTFLWQLGVWGSYMIRVWVGGREDDDFLADPARATTMRAISALARSALYIVIVLLALDNFGVNISALVAGLGVGGVAVALAAQNILGDLFASLSIVLDKPFVIGDYVVVGTEMGNVEKIGLKTTRVRSLTGEQLIFPNSDLLQSRIRNFKRMEERRILFSFGVIYQTSHEKLQAIPDMVKRIVDEQQNARFDRAHFKAFGGSSLDFEVVYWVRVPDYAAYMDVQQVINMEMYKLFEAEGIEFAYPTQTLFIAKPSEIAVSKTEA